MRGQGEGSPLRLSVPSERGHYHEVGTRVHKAEKDQRSPMSPGQTKIVISVDLANPTQLELDGLAAQYEMERRHERQPRGIWVVASTRGHHMVTEVLSGFAIRLIQKWINLEEGKRR
jgi:hypothetical protein